MCTALRTNTADEIATKITANLRESVPAGMARVAVRGLAASICASATRLNAMAAERADTMHRTIHPSCTAGGIPPAASMAPHSANGRAKLECSHLIISRVVLMFAKTGTEHCSGRYVHWALKKYSSIAVNI